ncbi:hypothetical protein IHE44_0011079 [Lamprotornis superbus]|uniref:Uncharacterized protein n=1 Tax=Lamprotornis superbus TaxID=245042 RepID=A0A835NGS3_9PASS|nr:hypothetical protein IHE44_0011079 [Lamprotornis superbus]
MECTRITAIMVTAFFQHGDKKASEASSEAGEKKAGVEEVGKPGVSAAARRSKQVLMSASRPKQRQVEQLLLLSDSSVTAVPVGAPWSGQLQIPPQEEQEGFAPCGSVWEPQPAALGALPMLCWVGTQHSGLPRAWLGQQLPEATATAPVPGAAASLQETGATRLPICSCGTFCCLKQRVENGNSWLEKLQPNAHIPDLFISSSWKRMDGKPPSNSRASRPFGQLLCKD